MSDTRFLLVRHAESTWNAAGRWQGQGDPPLSERGVRQAELLAERLRAERVDHLVCSDLRRARQTAQAIGEVVGLVPEALRALREFDVGRWSGLTRGQIRRADSAGLEQLAGGDVDVRVGGGECLRELRCRVLAAIETLARRHADAHVAVVTHGGVIRTLRPGVHLGNAELARARLSEIREAALAWSGVAAL